MTGDTQKQLQMSKILSCFLVCFLINNDLLKQSIYHGCPAGLKWKLNQHERTYVVLSFFFFSRMNLFKLCVCHITPTQNGSVLQSFVRLGHHDE